MQNNNLIVVALIIATAFITWSLKPDQPPEVGEKVIRIEQFDSIKTIKFEAIYPDVPKIPVTIERVTKVEKDSGFYTVSDSLTVLNDSTDLTVKATVVIDSTLNVARWKWTYLNKPFYLTKEIVRTEKIYIENPVQETLFSRFGHGIVLAVGYGIGTKQPDVFIGYGVTFRISKR